jgi:hypothetical protein
MLDLAGPATIWERTFPPGSAAFEIDEDWIGVLSSEGLVSFLDIRMGNTVRESKVAVPSGLTQIATVVTDRSIFVLLSSAVPECGLVASPARSNPAWRRVFVNGPIHAFDRSSGIFQWSQQIVNRGLRLDQVRDVPLLICVDEWTGPEDAPPLQAAPPAQGPPKRVAVNQETRTRFWCLDARTGKVIHNTSFPGSRFDYTVERNLAEAWVELRHGELGKTRFNYAPVDPEGK